jgi:hypothetical protein
MTPGAFPSLSASVADLPPRVRDLTLALARPTVLHSPVEVCTALIELLAWTLARRATIGRHELEWIGPVVEVCARRATDRAGEIYAAAVPGVLWPDRREHPRAEMPIMKGGR